MNDVFSNNLKKFRLQKKLTQEQAAEALGVNAQTISRWECNTTLPDVLMLPKIAQLYCVTVDDFYKETSTVYDNYAQKLACIYEKTRDAEDYLRADIEFRKARKSGIYSPEDRRMHGLIHQFMMWDCKNKAIDLYNSVIDGDTDKNSETYWMTRLAKINLYVLIGKADECINEQLERVRKYPDSAEEHNVLLRAFFYANRYEEGYEHFVTAMMKFPNYWRIYSAGGDICRKLKRYNEAFEYLNRAIELNPQRSDARHAKAACYEELGEYEKAYEARHELATIYKNTGYDIGAEEQEEKALRCLDMIAARKKA